MKKFFVFLIILIVTVSLSFTVYAYVKNNEEIYLNNPNLTANVGEEIKISFDVKNKKDQTTYTYTSSDDTNLTGVANTFTATKGGEYKISVKTSNKNYKSFTVNIIVGDGTSEYPLFVRNTNEFISIGTNSDTLNKCYKLCTDINLLNTSFTGFGAFTGSLDGCGYTVKNFSVGSQSVPANLTNVALFDSIGQSSTIKNLKIADSYFYGSFTNSSILAITNSGTLKNIDVSTCGITNTNAGGTTAGLVVSNNANISKVSASVDLVAKNKIAGLVATNFGGNVDLASAWGTINFVDSTDSGSISGLVLTNSANGTTPANVRECYSIINIVPSVSSKAAIIYSNNSNVANPNVVLGCFYNSSLCNSTYGIFNKVNEDYVCQEATNDQLKNPTLLNFYVNESGVTETWNANIWESSSNNGFLKINYNSEDVAMPVQSYNSDQYIKNASDLAAILTTKANDKDEYIITSDIDLSSYNSGAWTPIGYNGTNLTSGFGGNLTSKYNETESRYCKITGLNVTGYNYSGLFAFLKSSAVVSNLIIEGANITNGTYAGVLAGQNSGIINNVTVVNVDANSITNSVVSVESYYGGIVGINRGTITESSSNETINPTTSETAVVYAGGIVGKNFGMIKNCVAKNSLSAQASFETYLGGIVGSNTSTVTSCAFGGTIKADILSGNSNLGGIAGYAVDSSEISYCNVSAEMEGANVGGVIAVSQFSNVSNTQITGNFTGNNVAGVAALCSDLVINNICVREAVLSGFNSNSKSAGLAVTLPGKCKIGKIFLATSFAGNGKNYIVSSYTTIVKWFLDFNKQLGPGVDSNNCVYDKELSSGAISGAISLPNISALVDLLNKIDGGNSTEACQGASSKGFTVYTAHGFEQKDWNFVENEYPTLVGIKAL